MNYKDVISRSKIHPSRVKSIFMYGSRVYGTETPVSDWDFIMISNNSVPSQEIRSGDFNIHVLTPDHFHQLLIEHKPNAIECFYLPQDYRLYETVDIDFNLKINSLRHSFSHVSSNSWVKSKKKIEQGDYYLGIKSLFHSLRIPMFGIQICNYGRIVDYRCANDIFSRIMSKEWIWEDIDQEFRPLRNKILSEFRSVTFK